MRGYHARVKIVVILACYANMFMNPFIVQFVHPAEGEGMGKAGGRGESLF